MSFRIAVLITTVPALIPSGAPAQDDPRAEDILRWFPQASYWTISHTDMSRLDETEAYDIYMEFYGEKAQQSLSLLPLPPSLRKSWESFSRARINKIRMTRFKAKIGDSEKDKLKFLLEYNLKEDNPPPATITDSKDAAGRRTVITQEQVGDELWVFRYSAFDLLIAKALTSGEIEATGETALGRKMFFYKAGFMDEPVSDYFAYATATGELLVAGELRHLRAMIGAGMGLFLGLVDDEEYEDFHEIVPELGQTWTLTDRRPAHRQRLRMLRNDDGSEEEIAAMEERLEKDEQYGINEMSVGDQILQRHIRIYGEEEYAKQHVARQKRMYTTNPRYPKEVNEFMAMMQKKSTTERNGTWVITTTVHDEEFIESQKRHNELMRRTRAERGQEKPRN